MVERRVPINEGASENKLVLAVSLPFNPDLAKKIEAELIRSYRQTPRNSCELNFLENMPARLMIPAILRMNAKVLINSSSLYKEGDFEGIQNLLIGLRKGRYRENVIQLLRKDEYTPENISRALALGADITLEEGEFRECIKRERLLCVIGNVLESPFKFIYRRYGF